MKATGIVRRIDDLGRVVIPKEIRRTLRIREGDPLEIFTDREGEIILKKILSHRRAGYLCEAVRGKPGAGHRPDGLHHRSGRGHRSGWRSQEGLYGKACQPGAGKRNSGAGKCAGVSRRPQICAPDRRGNGGLLFGNHLPHISEGDAIGAVALFSREPKTRMGETNRYTYRAAANFLGRQMEQ